MLKPDSVHSGSSTFATPTGSRSTQSPKAATPSTSANPAGNVPPTRIAPPTKSAPPTRSVSLTRNPAPARSAPPTRRPSPTRNTTALLITNIIDPQLIEETHKVLPKQESQSTEHMLIDHDGKIKRFRFGFKRERTTQKVPNRTKRGRKSTHLERLAIEDKDHQDNKDWVDTMNEVRASADAHSRRDTWASKWDYNLAVLGYMVGTYSVQAYPEKCRDHGGVLYLVPMCFILFVFVCPLLLMEVSLAQYTSRAPTACWECVPLFKGLGVAVMYVVHTEATVSIRIVADYLYYASVAASLQKSWDNYTYVYNYSTGSACLNKMKAFYTEILLKRTPSYEKLSDLSTVDSSKIGIVLAVYVCISIVLLCGIRTLGRVARFTTLLPYTFFIPLLIYALTLPGAVDGIVHGMTPDLEELGQAHSWAVALGQVIVGLSFMLGVHAVLSSYNKFNAPCMFNVLLAAYLNIVTGLLASLAIFALQGHKVHLDELQNKNSSVWISINSNNTAKGSGIEWAFAEWPCLLKNHSIGWTVCFYVTIVIMKTDAIMYVVELEVTSIIDMFSLEKHHRKYVVLGVCTTLFLLTIPFCTASGTDLHNFINNKYHVVPFFCLCHCIAIGWLYGAERFVNDVEFMVGWDVTWLASNSWAKRWWVFHWRYLGPLLSTVIFIFSDYLYLGVNPKKDFVDARPPKWFVIIFQIDAWLGPIIVFVAMVKELLMVKGSVRTRLRTLTQPAADWGPAGRYHREMANVLNFDGAAEQELETFEHEKPIHGRHFYRNHLWKSYGLNVWTGDHHRKSRAL